MIPVAMFDFEKRSQRVKVLTESDLESKGVLSSATRKLSPQLKETMTTTYTSSSTTKNMVVYQHLLESTAFIHKEL